MEIILVIFVLALFLGFLTNKKTNNDKLFDEDYIIARTAYLRRYVEQLEHYRKQNMIDEKTYQLELMSISDELDVLEEYK